MVNEEYAKQFGKITKTRGNRYSLKEHLIAWSIFFGGIAFFYAVAIYLDYL